MKSNSRLFYTFLAIAFLVFPGHLFSQQALDASPSSLLKLEQAVMCEAIEAYEPKNQAIAFSMSIGEVLCFTAFDSVPKEMVIYHGWYRQDQLSTKRRLTLKPPRWSTFSRIQFREADKGPWRVEVADEDGNILRILRFSITD